MKILVLNSGSSSQKTALYEIGSSIPGDPPVPLWQGKIEWNGRNAELEVREAQSGRQVTRIRPLSRKHAVEQLLAALWSGKMRAISSPSDIDVVGHRVVHGGSKYKQPTLVSPAVRRSLARLAVLAPLHNRAEVEGMEIIQKRLGSAPQIAVFDTAFHSRMPPAAFVYPGPYVWLAQGIRRFGFHGINHQYCSERAAQLLRKDLSSLRLVICHLGNGCSLAAIQHGHSVDTTMGFTPLEGLMMGTRSGSVDPGILTYLAREKGLKAAQLDDLLSTKSGLLGISGLSSDMRQIIAAMKKGHARAKLAFDIFIHRLRRGIGEMIGVLGGLDALVFTAGIGENSPEIRSAACEKLNYLQLKLDPQKNTQKSEQDRDISASDSTIPIRVIRAQEDWAIACECWRIVTTPPKPKGSRAPSKQPGDVHHKRR
jgi:acetate kinase